jgi:hypothetical protein
MPQVANDATASSPTTKDTMASPLEASTATALARLIAKPRRIYRNKRAVSFEIEIGGASKKLRSTETQIGSAVVEREM